MTHWPLHKNLALGDRDLDLKSQIESVVCVSFKLSLCLYLFGQTSVNALGKVAEARK